NIHRRRRCHLLPWLDPRLLAAGYSTQQQSDKRYTKYTAADPFWKEALSFFNGRPHFLSLRRQWIPTCSLRKRRSCFHSHLRLRDFPIFFRHPLVSFSLVSLG